jgi:hypothetical protein
LGFSELNVNTFGLLEFMQAQKQAADEAKKPKDETPPEAFFQK